MVMLPALRDNSKVTEAGFELFTFNREYHLLCLTDGRGNLH